MLLPAEFSSDLSITERDLIDQSRGKINGLIIDDVKSLPDPLLQSTMVNF